MLAPFPRKVLYLMTLNEKKNVGERSFFEEILGKNLGSGLTPGKILRSHAPKASENPLFNRPPEVQIVSQFRAFSDT